MTLTLIPLKIKEVDVTDAIQMMHVKLESHVDEGIQDKILKLVDELRKKLDLC